MQVSLDLTIAVAQVDDAAPTYKDAVLAQGGGPGPDGYSPGTPYLVGDGEFSAVASGNPFTSEGERATSGGDPDVASGSASAWSAWSAARSARCG